MGDCQPGVDRFEVATMNLPKLRSVSLGAAEAALVALTLAATAGLGRVVEGAWLVPVGVAVVVAHLTVLLARRTNRPLWIAALLTAVVGSVTTVWLAVPGATTVGIPTTGTLTAVVDAVEAAWASFRTDVAPVGLQPGFVIVLTVAVFIIAFLADWAAFRLWSLTEAVVPATTLFVFIVLVGGESSSIWPATLFIAALAAFLFTHHQARLAASQRWLTPSGGVQVFHLFPAALLVVAAVVLATVVGPNLPGASDPPLLDWADQGGDNQRVTVSPMVDIRSRLVDQSDQLLFTVTTTTPSYWRLTSLETFDDGIWKSSGTYVTADGLLPAEMPPVGESEAIEQRFDMIALSAVWLPAAWQPVAVEAPSPVRWHAASGTLMVDNETDDSDGLSYRIRSQLPEPDLALLQQVPLTPNPAVGDTYVQLPADLTPVAQRVAREVTSGARTPYEASRALQDWFLSEFTYDLTVPAGHDGDAINAFLARRSGYCEQFAGTFAVMARTLGLPARVAVGFTPGEPAPNDPGTFEVRGLHAHAWPEVWIEGVGWIAFEPTPGRGAPGAEAWTGQPAQQQGGPIAPADTPTTVPAPTGDTPGALPPDPLPQPDDGQALSPDAPQDPASPTTSWSPLVLVLIVLAVAGGYIALVRGARSLVWRRRHRDPTPDGRTLSAWADVSDALASAGVPRAATETTDAYARRASDQFPTLADDITTVAHHADEVMFSSGLTTPETAATAQRCSARVQTSIAATETPGARLRRFIDPAALRQLATGRGPKRGQGPKDDRGPTGGQGNRFADRHHGDRAATR